MNNRLQIFCHNQNKELSCMKTKEAIRHNAKKLIAQHGYNGVSMRDIANAVGIRQSAIYNHFSNKQNLLFDLMQSHMEGVLKQIDEALNGIDGNHQRVSAFVNFNIVYHIDHPEDIFMAYMEIRSLEPENKLHIVEMRDAYEGRLKKILDDGIKAGDFKITESAVHAKAILAMLSNVTVWYKKNKKLTPQEVAEIYKKIVLHGLSEPDTV